MKVWLDTDIGSNVDDALCLAYLLAHPQCELVGISTVSGQAVMRARLASALCRAAGRVVPIVAGCDEPLLVRQSQPQVPQAIVLERWAHDSDFASGAASEALRQAIRTHPHEITLLAIGPLTNIALLFATDPTTARLLHALVLMGGAYGIRRVESNIRRDPHAAAIVYRAPVPVHRSVGLDVTLQLTMPAAQVRQRLEAAGQRLLAELVAVWMQQSDTIVFHDPLAATTIFDERVCGFERGTVEVELTSEQLCGWTHWTAGGAASVHEVATRVDVPRFFEQYFATVIGTPPR